MSESDDHKFSPAWWLRGPHRQTLWSQFFRRHGRPDFREERLGTPDGDTLFVYHLDSAPERPRLVLLHGLEGSVDSHYVRGFVAGAARRGWNATVLVFRGCGPEMNSAPRLYHSGETTDLRFLLERLVTRAPAETLFLAGVSLGGNVLLKFLGESGDSLPPQVRAAATVSVPYDLEAGCRHLQHGFARIYDRHFVRRLRAKARIKLGQHPKLFDSARLESARTIEDFDDAVTAPVHAFSGSHDYYARSSSIGFIDRIRIPTLLLSAVDDPFLPPSVLDRVREVARPNRFLRLQFTESGGHAGFVASATPFRARYWAEERLMKFFDSVQDFAPLAARDPSARS